MGKSLAMIAAALAWAVPAFAGSQTDLAKAVEDLLRVQQEQQTLIQQLIDEVNSLRAGQAAMKTEYKAAKTAQEEAGAATDAALEKVSWAKRFGISGDFRTRYEYIGQEGKEEINRFRLRARVGLSAELSETLDVRFQLASGSNDPTSTNQTLDGSFSSKDVWIDLAYLDWRPAAREGLHVLAGKLDNPFYTPGKTELIWDGDLRPEGAALTYDRTDGHWDTTLRAGAFVVDHDKVQSDTSLFGGQAYAKYRFDRHGAYALLGTSLFYCDNLEYHLPLFDTTDPMGNAVRLLDLSDPTSPLIYRQDFTELEFFAEAGMDIHGIPVSLFGDYVKNTEADFDDTGWLAGFKVGKTKNPGSWEFRYNYRELERNAAIGLFTDSSFGGGGTDVRGHKFKLGYQLSKRAKLGLTYFDNHRYLDSDNKWYLFAAPTRDYERLQLDVQLKF
ncbi:MAG: hypothetical protein GWP08_01420 [Nitrospiraceae bacterium]|nr:hypothetical protein [Nitrospiraceae bacterium]